MAAETNITPKSIDTLASVHADLREHVTSFAKHSYIVQVRENLFRPNAYFTVNFRLVVKGQYGEII